MYHVVIVEDDNMIAMLDRKFVEQDGRFQVEREFSDGRSALAYLLDHPVDLLILDVYMPILTGVELLRELRRRGILTEAVMVTAANDPQTVDALLKLGVVDYLVKPFTYPRFRQALDAFCRHQEMMAAETLDQEALDRVIFVGDTIFQENVGRCDLPGGNPATLQASIQRELFDLEGDYKLLPGHGGATTLEHERRYNPYMKLAADQW